MEETDKSTVCSDCLDYRLGYGLLWKKKEGEEKMSEKLSELEDLWICVQCGKEVKAKKGRIPACPKCGGTMKKVVVLK